MMLPTNLPPPSMYVASAPAAFVKPGRPLDCASRNCNVAPTPRSSSDWLSWASRATPDRVADTPKAEVMSAVLGIEGAEPREAPAASIWRKT
eukprot:CAMPEP_0171094596 /NCGR_PEP_ID=MMETSP0766_2-20121228/41701_1 /TAXON_ID=439317 /ORGANISM="Gambierdiscus australes, Strain CAWD 149" /LENGTH=91 /DNA_ID=CAMNT_0011553271 /DNA_START=180 /DNA_END=456 /DNA_ORIENTATION=+